jgi:hypothetical protein
MLAAVEVLLQLGACLGCYSIVYQFVEHCQKLCAGHFSPAFF